MIPSIQSIFESLLSGMAVDKSPVIHVIDWLGNGMSSRPEFECETTEEAEDWFVESLEAWRRAMGIEKMMHTGKPTWPVERTLLTSGTLDALLISKRDGGKRLETPWLQIKYQSKWDWRQPPSPPPPRPVMQQ